MPDVMATARGKQMRVQTAKAEIGRRGFTIVDVLVSMAVIAVLVGLLLPSLSMVRETTRRVICSSNMRQVGLALAMYADDYRGELPETRFIPTKGSDSSLVVPPQLQNVLMARFGAVAGDWDGLGHLFELDYLDHYGVFYCPSHRGDHPMSRYRVEWTRDWGQLVLNYQYRAPGSLASLGTGSAMVTDGLRTSRDYSHKIGANVLRSDFSTSWFSDPSGTLASRLPDTVSEPDASEKVDSAWQLLDNGR